MPRRCVSNHRSGASVIPPSPPPPMWPPAPIRTQTGVPPARSADVVVEHLRALVVLPAVDEEGRHAPRRQHRAEVERRPERVVGIAVRELLREQRQVLAGEELDRVTERKMVEALLERLHALRDRVG